MIICLSKAQLVPPPVRLQECVYGQGLNILSNMLSLNLRSLEALTDTEVEVLFLGWNVLLY